MVRFPKITQVEPKYRKIAFCIIMLLYVPIAFYVLSTFYHIYVTIRDPETETVTIEGHMLTEKHVSKWGPMGMIILEWDMPTFNTSVLDDGWTDYFDQLPDTPSPSAKVVPVPRASELFSDRAHRMVVINTSMLVPKFKGRTIHHVTPFLELRLTFFGPPHFNVFTAPESLTADKLNMLAVEGLHYHDSPLTTRCQAFLRNKGTYSFYIQKEIVPKENHIAWGLPWSDEPTRSRFYITGPFAADVDPKATSYRLLFFPAPMSVRQIVPFTVFGQVAECLTRVGAFMTLVHIAYNFLFRRKYPLTEEEKHNLQLTLRAEIESNPLAKELLHEAGAVTPAAQ